MDFIYRPAQYISIKIKFVYLLSMKSYIIFDQLSPGATMRTAIAKSLQSAPMWCLHWLYVITKCVSLLNKSEL